MMKYSCKVIRRANEKIWERGKTNEDKIDKLQRATCAQGEQDDFREMSFLQLRTTGSTL